MTDLLSEELVDVVDTDVTDVIEIPDEPKIEYTKTGKVKKPRSQAQIEALKKANAAWSAKQAGVVQKKKDALIETIELASKTKIMKQEKLIEKQRELALKRLNKVNKTSLSTPLEEEPSSDTNEIIDDEVDPEKKEKVAKIKKMKTKKPIVVVEQNSDSESEADDNNIIFIKRRPRKIAPEPVALEPIVPVPHFVHPPSAFSRPYFYNVNAMQ